MFRLQSVHCLLLLSAAACFVWAAPPQPRAAAPAPADRGAGTARQRPRPPGYAGPQSCMATACHGKIPYTGSTGQMLVQGAEYTYWRDHDPHARAALTLDGDLSAQIYRRLHISGDREQIAARCGVCHSPRPRLAAASFTAGQGVTCEDCHGASTAWRATHFRQSGTQSGMRDTKSLPSRTEICASCHLGDEGRRVDHDLIAAGHPPLRFEMASYHARLPKHWQDQPAALETRLLAHGQRSSLNYAVSELQRGAAQGWLDFAQNDCFACHHDLDGGGLAAPSGPPGSLAWNQWNVALATAAAGASGDVRRQVAAIDGLVRQRRLDQAAAAAGKLLQGFGPSSTPPAAPARQLTLIRQSLAGDVWRWDNAAQAYLGLVAVFQDLQPRLPEQSSQRVLTLLRELRSDLQFEQGADGPGRLLRLPPASLKIRVRMIIDALSRGSPGSAPQQP